MCEPVCPNVGTHSVALVFVILSVITFFHYLALGTGRLSDARSLSEVWSLGY